VKTTEHSLPAKAQGTNSPITDIAQFFAHTTEEYIQFEQRIAGLIYKIPALLPEQLVDECRQLRDQKAKLEILDQQMFDILDLAGSKITHEIMVQDHRVALARANMASDQLYQKLQAVKAVLQEGNAEVVDQEKNL
jgi:hypothetical protein